jgi:hypothetical protein
MTDPPPNDEPTTDSAEIRREDAIEPSTRREPTVNSDGDYRPPAASASSEPTHSERTHAERRRDREPTATSRHDVGENPTVDSNWWYWVAAVPIYVIAGIVAAVLTGLLFLVGVVVDIGGGMGVATGAVGLIVLLGSVGYGLVGLVLSILFPIGVYLDAKEIEAAAVSWDPDPVLYLLVAAASVLLTAFTVSFVVAIYYLYRRNQAVGVP